MREIVAGYVGIPAPGMPLVVVGDAPYADAYRAQVQAAAGDDPRIRFLGSVWDPELLDALYAHALTYLHGHSVGGTNPSLLRALGAGAPVSAYDVVFNREVAAGAGLYFTTPGRWPRSARPPSRTREAAIARGSAGQADVATRYRWSDVAAAYEDLARDLLSTRRGR